METSSSEIPQRSVAELVKEIEQAREARLEAKIKVRKRMNHYPSGIPTCSRQGVYEFVAYEQKKLFDTKLQARFEEGNRQEDWVVQELMKLAPQIGFRVVEQQVGLDPQFSTRYRLSGQIDGKIEFEVTPGDRRSTRRVPFEVKSMNPLFFDKVKTVEDLTHDAFLSKYYRQMQVYMRGTGETECVLIITDCLGHWRFIIVPRDEAEIKSILERLEYMNMMIDANQGVTDPEQWKLPERIEYDEDVCGKCAFAHICLPDVLNKSRVRFADDKALENTVQRHEELKPYAAEFDKIHERLKEFCQDKKERLIVTGEFILEGKPTAGREKLAPESEWAADELATFEKLKKKYTNKEPGWSWKIKRQDGEAPAPSTVAESLPSQKPAEQLLPETVKKSMAETKRTKKVRAVEPVEQATSAPEPSGNAPAVARPEPPAAVETKPAVPSQSAPARNMTGILIDIG